MAEDNNKTTGAGEQTGQPAADQNAGGDNKGSNPPAPASGENKVSLTEKELEEHIAAAVSKKLTELGVKADKPKVEKKTGTDTGTEKLEHYVTAVKAGVPYDKAERYARLAETYMDKDTDFAAALVKAVKDFPYASPPASAGTAGQDGSASKEGLPDEGKIKDIFAKG